MDYNNLIIIINGKGESGKDYIINKFTEYMYNNFENILIFNVSTIDFVRDILYKNLNIDIDNKSFKLRKLMSDMKRILVEYNDYPFNNTVNKVNNIILHIPRLKNNITFIHCREKEEIDKLYNYYNDISIKNTNIIKILIHNPHLQNTQYGNNSDDNVDDENIQYDYIFINDNILESQQSISNIINKFTTNILPQYFNLNKRINCEN